VDITGHQSRSASLETIREQDLILALEPVHLETIIRIDPKAKQKTYLLAGFDPKAGQPGIDDPVGQSIGVYRDCAEKIFSALQGVIKMLPELRKGKKMQINRIAIGSDHRGFALKNRLVEWLREQQIDVADCGAYNEEASDYSEAALAAARLLRDRKVDRGILACSNGIGMCIAANKVPGVYAAVINSPEDAGQARRHNGVNMLCLSGERLPEEKILEIVKIFLDTPVEDGDDGRHARRRKIIRDFEKQHYQDFPDEEE